MEQRPTPEVILTLLGEEFSAERDPGRAVGMAAYMRDQFAFFGLPAPERRRIQRGVVQRLAPPTEAEMGAVARACWDRDEREFQYFAVDWVGQHVGRCSTAFLPTVERLITTKSWWDTVDPLATRCAGSLVGAHPELRVEMDRWLTSHDRWLVRSAILHQLGFKEATDAAWLFGACLRRGDDGEFFVRKAIGWALREYSKTDGPAVERFVAGNAERLSNLSRREAVKWLERRRG